MSTTTSAGALPPRATIHGHIAARIDRLPLTVVQRRLAILVTVTFIPGSLIPAFVIRMFGIRQSQAILEQVST
jgi:hypothetical protein